MDVSITIQKFTTDLSAEEKDNFKKELAAYLNELLQHDFSALVQLLYRTDVSEQKLKILLKENKETDAGELMAELLIQRQQEKATVRNLFSSAKPTDADEVW